MACVFHAFTFPRWLRHVTTPAALGLSASGPLTIVGWAKYFDTGADTIAAIMADDGAADSFNARKQQDDRFTTEMIVDNAFQNSFVTGVSIDTWYFVEWFFSSSERTTRLNNGVPGTNSNALGAMSPFTALTIGIGKHPGAGPGEFEGCLAELAFINRELTDVERIALAAGNIPPLVFGLSNIAFYVPLDDEATCTQAYNFGASVTMEIPQLTPLTCGDGPDLITESSSSSTTTGIRRGPRPLWETPLDRDGGPKKTNQLWQHEKGKFFPVDGYKNPPKEKPPRPEPPPPPEPLRNIPMPSTIEELVQMAQGVTLQNYADLEYDNPELAKLLWPLLAKRYQKEMN